MSFSNGLFVFCPKCPPHLTKQKQQIGIHLECTVHNYSGCGVDFGECPECGGRFQVSYKVDEVTEIK